jgi:hypothetical protein
MRAELDFPYFVALASVPETAKYYIFPKFARQLKFTRIRAENQWLDGRFNRFAGY